MKYIKQIEMQKNTIFFGNVKIVVYVRDYKRETAEINKILSS